jgi:hypothetical protein
MLQCSIYVRWGLLCKRYFAVQQCYNAYVMTALGRRLTARFATLN